MTSPYLRLLGYRGTSLAFLALVWVAVGARVLMIPDPDPSFLLPVELLPLPIRIALWWVPAAVAFTVAWFPTRNDKLGFVALVIPASIRGVSYTLILPWHPELWIDSLVWVGIVGYIVTLSGWPEPSRRRRPRGDRETIA